MTCLGASRLQIVSRTLRALHLQAHLSLMPVAYRKGDLPKAAQPVQLFCLNLAGIQHHLCHTNRQLLVPAMSNRLRYTTQVACPVGYRLLLLHDATMSKLQQVFTSARS